MSPESIAFAVWFGSEIVAPRLANASLEALRPGWESRLSRRASRESGVRISRRKLSEWLRQGSTFSALARLSASDIAALASSLRSVVADDRRHRGESEDQLDTSVELLLTHLIALFLRTVDRSLAVDVADYRQRSGFDDLRGGQQQILTTLQLTADFDDNLVNLPFNVVPGLKTAYSRTPVAAARLAAGLADESQAPADIVRQLVVDPPGWLTDGDPGVLAALGEFGAAHGDNDASRWAFEQQFELAVSGRSRVAARAALAARENGEQGIAEQWISRAQLLAANSDRYVNFVEAVVNHGDDPDRIGDTIAAGLLDDPEYRLPGLLTLARVHIVLDRHQDAIGVLEPALDEYPESSALPLLLAQILAERATDLPGDSAFVDFRRARDLALQARDLRRAWRGDSAEAVVLAAQVSFELGAFEEVLRLALTQPDGEATENEAAHVEARVGAFLAATALGRDDLAQQLAQMEGLGSASALMRGSVHESRGEREAALSEFRLAYESAATDVERSRSTTALAQAGEWPLPGWDELREVDEVRADELAAMSEIARGLSAEAVDRLRLHNRESRRSALLLAMAYTAAGDTTAAVAEMREAARRFDDPTFLARAATAQSETDLGAAVTLAHEALVLLPEGAVDRASMRRLILQEAGQRSDWPSVEALARAMQSEGHSDPNTRWVLVISLAYQGRLDEASEALHSTPRLDPRDESEAIVWMGLIGRTTQSDDDTELILEIAERFAESEYVVGGAMQRVLLDNRDQPLPAELASAFQGLQEDFFNRFPDSQVVRRIAGESPEELVQEILRFVRPAAPIVEIAERVWKAELPAGLLAIAAGKSYVESLILSTGHCLPACRLSSSQEEASVAADSIGGQIVVAVDAIHLASLVQSRWPGIRGAFRSLHVPRASVLDAVRAQESLSQRSTASFSRLSDTEGLGIDEISPDRADAMANRAEWIAGQALSLDVVDDVESTVLTDIAADDNEAWLAPIDLALQRDVPLLTDDVVLREVARHVGVRAFGTVALLQALHQASIIERGEFADALVELAKHHVVDLPLDEQLIERLGQSDAWQPAALAYAMSRSAFWTEPQAFESFRRCMRAVNRVEPQLVSQWIGSATRGVVGAIPEENISGAVAALIGAATTSSELWTPTGFRLNIDAARDALGDRPQLDPLPALLRMLCSTLVESLGYDVGSQVLMSLTSELEDDDRTAFIQLLLGGCD